MSGAYRRRIRLATAGEAPVVVADLEDDFHRFGVDLRHDGKCVVAVEGRALRFPWTACGTATDPLRALAGMPLSTDSTAVGSWTSARVNCTHLFDLAGLAVAHAAAGRTVRQYDVEVPDRDHDFRTTVRLWRDGVLLLEWDVSRTGVEAPPPFAGIALRGSFLRWARESLDADTAEAAVVLRRACEISYGRLQDLDRYDRAGDLGDLMAGTCHTFTDGTMQVALRRKGSGRDFSTRPDDLLA